MAEPPRTEPNPLGLALGRVPSGLFILTAGSEVANPSDLLDGERLHPLIQSFRQVFDIVVVDCPPVMAVADAAIVANAAMSVLLVVGAGTTSPEGARAATDRLRSVDAQVIGVVLNKMNLETRSEYQYTYETDETKAR